MVAIFNRSIWGGVFSGLRLFLSTVLLNVKFSKEEFCRLIDNLGSEFPPKHFFFESPLTCYINILPPSLPPYLFFLPQRKLTRCAFNKSISMIKSRIFFFKKQGIRKTTLKKRQVPGCWWNGNHSLFLKIRSGLRIR